MVEKEAVIGGGRRELLEAEEVFSDEAVGGAAEGEGVAEEVVAEAAGRGVEDVGEHDVHGVLGADGAGAEHGEAELHGEDEVGGEEEVGGVDGEAGVEEAVVDGFELAADVLGGGGGVGRVGAEERRQLIGEAAHGFFICLDERRDNVCVYMNRICENRICIYRDLEIDLIIDLL